MFGALLNRNSFFPPFFFQINHIVNLRKCAGADLAEGMLQTCSSPWLQRYNVCRGIYTYVSMVFCVTAKKKKKKKANIVYIKATD